MKRPFCSGGQAAFCMSQAPPRCGGLYGTPALPDDAPVMFGDLVQIADYDTPEDAAAYPPSKTHMDLVEFSTPMLKKVTAIDFEM